VNVVELHRRACEGFDERVEAISDDQWDAPTPCPDWDVRALVGHLVTENCWTPPLLEGSTIEAIGDRFDGDLLGADPKNAWARSVKGALDAVQAEGAMERTVHLSSGEATGSDYTWQLFADHLIHAWDLARATNNDERLDPELVSACSDWFTSMEHGYRQSGAITERPDVPDDAGPQTELLAMFGRMA